MTAVLRAYRQAYSGLPREVWLLAAAIFVNRCGSMVVPFLALYLQNVHEFSPTDAGKMLAVYGVGGIAGAQLGGRLTERLGGVTVAFLGLVFAVPGFVAIPWCGAGGALVAALLCLSVTFESMRPAIASATAEFCPPERVPKAFALNRLAANLGFSIGPVVGGVLATIDYQLLFYANASCVAAAAVVVLFGFGLHRRANRSATRDASTTGQGPLADRRYLAFLALHLMSAIVFMQVLSVFPMFLNEHVGFNEAQIGLLWLVNTGLIVAVEMLLTDRLNNRSPLRMVAWGVTLVGLGFAATPVLVNAAAVSIGVAFAVACGLAVVWTIGEILSSPFSLAHVAKASERGKRGEYMGLFSTTMATAFVLAPLIGTSLYQIDPRLPWLGCLVMAFLLPAGYVWLARVDADDEPLAGAVYEPSPGGR